MPKPGPLSLNTATVKERWGLAECIEGCARHGIPGISPWRDVLQAMGVEEAARQIRDAGLTVTGLCRGGMFTAPDAAGRAAAIEDNRRAIAEAHAIGAACLVMVCGGLPPGSRDLPGAREMVREGLHAIMGEARDAGVTIAFGTDLLGETHVRQSEEFAIRARVLPSADIFASATTVAARLIGMEGKLGVVAPGAVADLLVVQGAPLEDVAILADHRRRIQMVMKAGAIHRRAE